MGSSEKAYDANCDLLHAVAWMLLMRRRNPHMVISIENPRATLRHHPLIGLVERPSAEGGLGLMCGEVAYCCFDGDGSNPPPRKDTNLWGDPELIGCLVDTCTGGWKYKCVCGVPHKNVRGTNHGEEREDLCAYPLQLCHLLAQSAKQVARMRDMAAGMDDEGYHSVCAECEREITREQIDGAPCCSLCPRAYHRGCCDAPRDEGYMCKFCRMIGDQAVSV